MTTQKLTLADLEALVIRALTANKTSARNAAQVAAAIVTAEADGLKGHGASRVPFYAAQAKAARSMDMLFPNATKWVVPHGVSTPNRGSPTQR